MESDPPRRARLEPNSLLNRAGNFLRENRQFPQTIREISTAWSSASDASARRALGR
jgi:hypothetical protein